MRDLTFDELALVAGGTETRGSGSWWDSLWSWISDFFSDEPDPGIQFDIQWDFEVDGGNNIIPEGVEAEISITATGTAEPFDVDLGLEIFGYNIPLITLHVQGTPDPD